MKKLIVALCVALSVTTAKAEFWTGNDLYYSIISTDINKRFQALGYIMGIYDMGIHGAFCPQTEQGITVGQLQDMIKQHLEQNPSQRHRVADRLIAELFKQVWPCAHQRRNPV